MRIFVAGILLFLSGLVSAQTTGHGGRVLDPQAVELRRAQEKATPLRALSEPVRRSRLITGPSAANLGDIYREPTDKELKELKLDPADLQRYANFANAKKAGIIRLEPYAGCGDGTRVVSASEACVRTTIPGKGSDYSFRKRNYRLGRLADLRLDEGVFTSPGVLQQAVFVGVGDVPLDAAGKHTPGVAYLLQRVPPEKLSLALPVADEFRDGVEKDGFFYASHINAVEGMTYVLRSIAYRGNAARSIGGVLFNEMDLDDRADITVAFRIVRTHDTGGVTLIWKEIERKDAPKLVKDDNDDRREDKGRNEFVAKGK